MRSPNRRTVAVLMMTGLVAAACAGPDSSGPTTTISSAATTTAAVAPTPTTTSTLAASTSALGDSPLQIARSFIEARDGYNATAAEALFVPDAIIHDDYMESASEYHAHFAWHESADWEWRTDECSATEAGPPVEVTCSYVMENAWTKALDVDPITGGTFRFVISNGLIQEILHTLNIQDFSLTWETFQMWIRTNHPEDYQVMYIDLPGGREAASWKPDSVALFDKYTDEFVSTIGAESP